MCQKRKYDIFISYRHKDGAQYARILQLELEKRSYRVFLDYDELQDGTFNKDIERAIAEAPVFIFVLTPKYLENSGHPDSWVSKEFRIALASGSQIIPVTPDQPFDKIPEGTPEDIAEVVKNTQHSLVTFGAMLGASIDMMVKHRIQKYIKSSLRFRILFFISAVAVIAAIIVAISFILESRRKAVMAGMTAPSGQLFRWDKNITTRQLKALESILSELEPVQGGSFMMGAPENTPWIDGITESPQRQVEVKAFYMGRYEVSRSQWYGILGGRVGKDKADLPVNNVSNIDCEVFCKKLRDLSGIQFRLPTEEEWEYAARGGAMSDGTRFSGNDNPLLVAWFNVNSGGTPHPRNDTHGGFYCNALNLFDMSGNVSEWCCSPFRLYKDIISGTDNPEIIDPEAMVVRGGNFDSAEGEITVTWREPVPASTSSDYIGLRLVVQ